MRITGREYKTMLDPERFAAPDAAVDAFWEELVELSGTTVARAVGRFDKKEDRRVTFLDTPDLTLRRNGLVLRSRGVEGGDQYTLKARSEDRYLAAGTDVRASRGSDTKEKLEEDIAPPFRCRFSYSGSTTLDGRPPGTVGEASAIFPVIGTVSQDGRPLAAEIPLRVVNGIRPFETVHEGPTLVFDGLGPGGGDEKASVALIVWTNGEGGRPLVAEFSFRVKDKEERFSRGLALAARSFFDVALRHDWCRPDGVTKTEYVYRDTRGD